MKRSWSLILVIAMLLALLAGCSSEDSKQDNTLTLNVGYNNAGEVTKLVEAMQLAFPDINFDIHWHVGDNPGNFQMNKVRNDDASDIIFYPNFTDLEIDTSRMLDLSGYSFVGNLSDEVLNVMNVNGGIYQIPSNLEVRCIAYNKTLFEENGWDVPTNYSELLSLVKQIRAEKPELTPIAMGALPIFSFNLVATMSQASSLFTTDGQAWEQSFFAGEASIADGFADGLTMMEELIDAGAFNFKNSIGKSQVEDQLVNREAAMYAIWIGTQDLLDAFDGQNTTDELGLIPYYGISGEDTIVGYRASIMWSLNKKLADKGNEKKLENALKVTEWFLSAEAQSYMDGQIPVVKNSMEVDSRVTGLLQLAEGGYQEHTPYMGYEHIIPNIGQLIQQAVLAGSSEGMREKIITVADRLNAAQVANGGKTGIAALKGDCDEGQTAQIAADALQSSGLGDFALITHTGKVNDSVNSWGASGNLYEGPVSLSDMTALIMGIKANLTVPTVELTGAEVKTLLENGKVIGEEAFPYYWSGIDVTLDGDKVTSVKLGGTELDDNATYTVVFSPNDYPAAYKEKAVSSEQLLLALVQSYFQNNPQVETPAKQRS